MPVTKHSSRPFVVPAGSRTTAVRVDGHHPGEALIAAVTAWEEEHGEALEQDDLTMIVLGFVTLETICEVIRSPEAL